MFAPLGTELGTIFFGARFRHQQALDKQKGLVISSVLLSTWSAIICSALLWWIAPHLMDDSRALRTAIPAILFWTPLHTLVGLIRAQKDMKGNAVVYQLLLPTCLLSGIAIVIGLNLDLYSALIAFCIAHGLSLMAGIQWTWKHYGALFRDKSIIPIYDLKALLRYSIPIAGSQLVFRLNAWMDILMLGWLVTTADVGIYKIAVSLVMICGLPINAIITIFNTIIVELISQNKRAELNRLLQLVTKWIMLFTLPVLISLYVLPDIILGIFDTEYLSSQTPLRILIAGQLIWASCSLCMRLIPMSGYAFLNFCNGVVAASLNIGLNYWLIPKYGTIGAAMATSLTLSIWSCWRLGEAWILLKCFPFTKITFGMLIVAVGLALTLEHQLAQTTQLWRFCTTISVVAVFVATSWYFGKQDEDNEIIQAIRNKWNRLRAR